MFGFLSRSLLLRAGLAMGVITALAVGGMASAVFVARSAHGEAGAVNQAGSLRMQSYRIAAALESGGEDSGSQFGDVAALAGEFEQRLESPRLSGIVDSSSRKSIRDLYGQIAHRWREDIRPLFDGYRETSEDPDALNELRRAFGSIVGAFVGDIDHLVRLLEEDAEARMHMLGLFQGISLFLTLGVAIATLYLLQTDVVGPLRDLFSAAERAGKGDFSARVSHIGPDELGRVGQTFNWMAEELSKMYARLEERVAEKTRKLTQRNQSLELLYSAARELTRAPVEEPTYRKLLDDIGRVVDAKGITLCRKEESGNRAFRIALNGPVPPMCWTENCELCLGDGRTRILGRAEHGAEPEIVSVPVGDQTGINGVLLVGTKADKPLEPWQIQLLETLGKHIGISVDVSRRVNESRRLALLEERGVMARELHDSLAQSLTYLKIQVTRLSVMMRSGAQQQAVEDALAELKGGLEAAYRQLRELLTTFRLRIDGGGLGSALAQTVEDFHARADLDIELDNRLKTSVLTANEEIHVLQIVREALSNVIQHSKATRASVSLALAPDGRISVTVEDNGIGIPGKPERSQHYGLAIMRERASSLDGELSVERRLPEGTRVALKFRPWTAEPSQASPDPATAS